MRQTTRWIDGRPIYTCAELGQGRRINEWLVTGPFTPNGPGRFFRDRAIGLLDSVDEDFLGGERTITPKEGMRHPNPTSPGASTWERLSAAEGCAPPSAFNGDGVVYAATYIDVEEEADIAVIVEDVPGPNPPLVQVLLDGKEIGRRAAPGVAHLLPGQHCLMLKVTGGASAARGLR